MISTLYSRKVLGFKLTFAILILTLGAGLQVEGVDSRSSQLPSGTQEIQDLLAYPFDSNAPLGTAQNPAVIIPAASALFTDLPVAKKTGDLLLIPVAELQKVANQPFARALVAPILSQLSSVKSFDGFSAIDTTSLGGGPSSILRPANMVSRKMSGDNLTEHPLRWRPGFCSTAANWFGVPISKV